MRKYGIYFILILFIALNVILINTAKKYEPQLQVKNLVIVNNQIIPTEVLMDFIQIKDKSDLTHLTAETIVDRIEKYPYVKKAEGQFIDSTTLKVIVEEVEPFLSVVTIDGNYILTKDKRLLLDSPALNILDLPLVNLTDLNLKSTDLLKEKTILEKAYNSFYRIHQVDIALFEIISELNINRNKELTFYLSKPKGKILVGDELSKSKAVYLSEFWRKEILTNYDKNYEYIDLRFNDQIVVKYFSSKVS